MATVDAGLVRTIGRWSLAALMLNTMIGASIFGLPSLIAARLGRLSPIAYFIAFAGVAVIAACLAEVASYFQEAGGPYLYAREAFGRFVGIQIGWLTWLSRISACSGVANLFITYLTAFVPAAKAPLVHAGVLTVLIGFLAGVNYRGVTDGKWLSNFFTITKVLLLTLFVAAGLTALALHPEIRVVPEAVPAGARDWFAAVLLMVYAYGGFEAALFASGEASNPRKDSPTALAIALVTATSLYVAVQYVVIYTLPNPAATTKPALDAARQFLGPVGVSLVAAGTLVSVYGYLSANMLHTPRVTFAMGERGDFPAFFAAIHPKFRTPHVSILAFAALLIAFSIFGDFRWNATLSAVARLFMYGAVAAALPALRRKNPEGAAFRLPGGTAFAVVALVFTGLLLTTVRWGEGAVVLITFAIAAVNWFWARRSGLGNPAES
ncbi:MAG TPA: amino acid permease [Candidatus Acidoferrum sp.]|nr:amino acid permease [Candidatus Acidoferrum sp.]